MRRSGRDAYLAGCSKIIRRHGWMVQAVLPDHEAGVPTWSYTVGLTGHDHPEPCIMGLDPPLAQELLNELGRRVVADGERLTPGQVIGDLVSGYDVRVHECATDAEGWPFMTALRLYPDVAVTALQVVFPDPEGRFPGDAGYAMPAQVLIPARSSRS